MRQIFMIRFWQCLLFPLLMTALAQASPLTWGSQAAGDIASCDGQEMVCYAPGIIRPDQGTVQMTVLMGKPSTELGNDWESLFSMAPAQDIGGNSLLTLMFPELSYKEQGLWLVARSNDTGSTSYGKVYAPNITFSAGQTVHMAFTWGNGELRVYFNGTRVGTTTFTHVITPMPAVFRVARLLPYQTQSMKISSVQLADAAIATQAQNALATDADTTFLAVDALATAQTFTTPWHSTAQYASVTPYWSPASQCFVLGDAVTYPVLTVNQSTLAQSAQVTLDVVDSQGITVVSQQYNLTLAAMQGYQEVFLPVTGLPTLADHYTVHSTVVVGTSSKEYNSNIVVVPMPQAGVTDGYLAQYLGYHYDFAFNAAPLKQMGVHWVRMWGINPLLWFNIEPVQGQYLWDKADAVIQQAAVNDLQLLGLLGNMPRWAAVEPDEAHKALTPLANVPGRWKPRDMNEWENYASQVMNRYKNDIKHWEVCNEIDFHPPGLPASFSGSTAEYLQMLQRVNNQSQLIGQGLKVLLSGLSLNGACDPNMPTDLINSGVCNYIDVFNVHGYEPLDRILEVKNEVYVNNPGFPFWQTEHMLNNITNENQRLWLTVANYLWYMEKGFQKFFTFGFYGVYFDRSTLSPSREHYVNTVFQNQIRACNSYAGKLAFDGDAAFSVRHKLWRTDGKLLTVIGSEVGGYDLVMNIPTGTTAEAVDLMGHAIPIEQIGSQIKLTVNNIAYIVSNGLLTMTSIKLRWANPLMVNGGFEEVLGDIGIGGLESGVPANWTLRQTTYDPLGSIVLNTDARSGSYAIKINSSGAGRVYLFEDIKIPAPGYYLFTAYLKKTDPLSAGVPFLKYYDRDNNLIITQTLPDVTSSYQEYSMLIYFDQAPPTAVAMIIGIDSGAGELRVDDVDFKVAQLIDNGGFETIVGDVTTIGLEACLPANWTLRQTTYDPGGSIVLSTDARSDAYAMKVNSSGAGRVYLFEDVKIPAAGDYLFTAHLKKTDPLSTAAPYLSYYDRDNNLIPVQTLPNVTAAYQSYSMIMHFNAALPTPIALMTGIYTGAGELLVDDVDFKPVKLLTNGGFETIVGDVATIGLEACLPANWTLRQTTYDPGGSIVLSTDARSDAYAMKVNSSGAGRVYLFEDVTITAPGDYLFSAYLKKTDPLSTAVAYLSYYDRDNNLIDVLTLSDVTSVYQNFSRIIHFDEALPTPVALIVGIYTGSGELMVDDVNFTSNQ